MKNTTKLQNPDFPVIARAGVKALSSSMIREVANHAAGKPDVLPFWFGESSQPTNTIIGEAALLSIKAGETFYSQNLGRPYLRAAISEYLSNLHNVKIDTDRIAVTGSGVSGLMLCTQLLVEPGDRVVAVTPIWPNILEIPRVLGAEVIRVPLSVVDNCWALDLDKLLESLIPSTRALILNSPNNPTGWMIDEKSIDVILDHCRKHGIWIITDDVYERLVYESDLKSAPSFLTRYEDGDRIISANSFSKAWTMTGWRIGWLTVPPSLANDLAKLIEFNDSCVFEPVQRAAHAAIKYGEPLIADLRTQLASSRKVLVDALSQIPGIEIPAAGGAMYVYFRVSGADDTLTLAKRLVDEASIGLAPGGAFGAEGNGWLRWCHAVDPQILSEGVYRIKRFLSTGL